MLSTVQAELRGESEDTQPLHGVTARSCKRLCARPGEDHVASG